MSGSRHVLPRAPWYVSPGRTRPMGSAECRRADQATDDRRDASGAGYRGGLGFVLVRHSRDTPVGGFGEQRGVAVVSRGLALDLRKHPSVLSILTEIRRDLMGRI